MSETLKAFMITLLLAAGGTLSGCQEEGPMERAGENMDEAMDEAGDAVEQVGDEAEQALDN